MAVTTEDEPGVLEIQLHDAITPDECKEKVMGSKIELRLKKKRSTNWTSLDATAGGGGIYILYMLYRLVPLLVYVV